MPQLHQEQTRRRIMTSREQTNREVPSWPHGATAAARLEQEKTVVGEHR